MEAAILAAEEAVTQREAEVERAAMADHTLLAEACRALEEAQKAVERLYARWQELENRRGGVMCQRISYSCSNSPGPCLDRHDAVNFLHSSSFLWALASAASTLSSSVSSARNA